MIGSWLFEFGNLENRNESLRRILKTEIIRDNDCRKIISNNKGRLKVILDNTEEAEVNDFKCIFRRYPPSDSGDTHPLTVQISLTKLPFFS
ncbi:hypothetical protein D0T84_22660, partial [Dysgonomonas sp. 521]|uniref:hypothetical protein n=1 Tax=Dysgonomonas sp. 521 TaxID=2302932 RepID=UPI001C87ED9E